MLCVSGSDIFVTCSRQVSDTKGCITFATGLLKPDGGPQASYCLCVAVKRQVRTAYVAQITSAREEIDA